MTCTVTEYTIWERKVPGNEWLVTDNDNIVAGNWSMPIEVGNECHVTDNASRGRYWITCIWQWYVI